MSQVKAYMLSYITKNNLKRNDQLPSEASIAKDLGVSRNTLREAYISLENEGIIIRRHGVGTFVAHPPRIQDSLNEFSPFAQIIQDVGYTPKFRTLTTKIIPAPPDVADVLKLGKEELVHKVTRLVFADEKPVIYVEDFIPQAVDAEIKSWDEFDGNMVEMLSNSLQTALHQIQSHIRAEPLPKIVSQHLELPTGTPVLSVRSTIFNKENVPVTYSKLCFNSEIVELNIMRTI